MTTPLTVTDWEAAGGCICLQCHSQTVRFKQLPNKKEVCPECYIRYQEKFAKMEASLGPLLNSKNPGLARRAKRYLMKKMA